MGNKTVGTNNVVMLGSPGAGKTTMLYTRAAGEGEMETIGKINPTLGFNFERIVTSSSITLNVWDVGGAEELNYTWNSLYLKHIPV